MRTVGFYLFVVKSRTMENTTSTERPRITPRDFFLWAGAMIALYWSVIAFLFLIFDYINYALPDPLRYYTEPYSSGMPYNMASILILLPTYVLLARAIRKTIEHDETRSRVWVRRWALIFTMFVAGTTVAGDLIYLLTSFFRGEEFTLAFALKVLLVLLVAGAGFLHFYADLKGYWFAHPRRVQLVGTAVCALGLAAIISGFFIVGTPWQARLHRYDDQKVSDLQNLQYQVLNYWQNKEKLPDSLAAAMDPLSGGTLPTDPQSGAAYGYRTDGPLTFELCANFNASSTGQNATGRIMAKPASYSGEGGTPLSDNWAHGKGDTCFTRTIDPERYPPFSKTR